MKITDLKCAFIGRNPVVRITTDKGIDGFGELKTYQSYVKPHVLFYRERILGEDPTNVERVMLKIRQVGGFKPWGSAVSAIEVALWDIAGKAAGLPVYKLLGGKIRDKVRVYKTGTSNTSPGDLTSITASWKQKGPSPQELAESIAWIKESKEGFTLTKQGIMYCTIITGRPDFGYSEYRGDLLPFHPFRGPTRGALTERGLKYAIACAEEMKKVLGDEIGLALDCGPGWMIPDAIRMAKAVEPLNIMWLEDLLTGDLIPYVSADMYREVTRSTSTPIHTGEQIYLRNNFQELIEKHAVRVIGPDPLDVGGIAELKWIAEYADLHGILIAPHGVTNGLIGLAAAVHAGAAMPDNFIAFEYSPAYPEWWYDIIDGLPDPIVKNGFIEVWDKPGLGVLFNKQAAKKHLTEEDTGFFD